MVGAKVRGSVMGSALVRYRTALLTVAMLSTVLNVLLLGGSIYMMLVYDSVLPSHSFPTLFSLLAMISCDPDDAARLEGRHRFRRNVAERQDLRHGAESLIKDIITCAPEPRARGKAWS